MRIAQEEIFGPVAYLTSFRDEDEAIRLANDTQYGLANSVWTSDLTRASRVAEAMVALVLADVMGSDHCPVGIDLD